MMKNTISILALMLALAACSQNKNSGGATPAPDPNVPVDVKEEPVVDMAKLTADQKSSVKSFSQKSQLIPQIDAVLFDATNASKEALDEQNQRLAKMSADTRAVYDKINQVCQIVKPHFKMTGDHSGNTGSEFFEDASASIGGTGCVLNFGSNIHRDSKVLFSNLPDLQNNPNAKLQLIEESNEVSDDKMTVTDADLSTRSDESGRSGHDSTYSKMAVVDGALAGMYIEKNMAMSLLPTAEQGKIDVVGVYRMAISKSAVQMYFRINFTRPDFLAVVQVYVKDNAATYFVNGESFTSAQIQDLFGTSFTGVTSTRGL